MLLKWKIKHPLLCISMQHGLCNEDLHLSIQADAKDILWFLVFKRGVWHCRFHTSSWPTMTDTHSSISLLVCLPPIVLSTLISYSLPFPITRKSSWDTLPFPPLPSLRCHVSSHHTSSPPHRVPAPFLQPLMINWGHARCRCNRTDQILETLQRTGAAELWRKDSQWAWLGRGPFKSNRIVLVAIPAWATLSEQITFSSKGYDSPWHLCWEPAIPDSWGLILNS